MMVTPSALAIEQSAAFDILQTCRHGTVPANADLGAAIAAHRMAFRDDPRLAAYALRAVIYAVTRTREQAQQQVDYLTELPFGAWEGVFTGEAAAVRESTLSMCAWWLTRITDA